MVNLGLVKRERYTVEQCVSTIDQNFKNKASLATAIRKFETKCGQNIGIKKKIIHLPFAN